MCKVCTHSASLVSDVDDPHHFNATTISLEQQAQETFGVYLAPQRTWLEGLPKSTFPIRYKPKALIWLSWSDTMQRFSQNSQAVMESVVHWTLTCVTHQGHLRH